MYFRPSLLLVSALVIGCASDETPDAGTDAWMPTDGSTGDPSNPTAPTAGSETTPPSTTRDSDSSPDPQTTTGPTASGPGPTDPTDPTGPTTDPTDPTMDPTDSGSSDDSTGGIAPPTECTADEVELIELVNEYRAENGLPAIPASPSMCTVGHLHAEDLANENPHTVGDCNLHSWSDAGAWSACCYTPDHAQAQCMWDKPRELTEYPGNGYENAAGGGGTLTPQQALDLWKGSPGHNAVILNEGTWANISWGALGAGMHQGYAVLWFGEEPDPAG